MNLRFLAVGLPLFSGPLACVQPQSNGSALAAGPPEIATVHGHRCGRCHEPPEPGTRTRDHLEAAFVRHRNRVRLTSAQWTAMMDYLAAPPEGDSQAR